MKKFSVIICVAAIMGFCVLGLCACDNTAEPIDVDELLAQCTHTQTYEGLSFNGGRFTVNMIESSIYMRTAQCNAVTISCVNETFEVTANATIVTVKEISQPHLKKDRFVIITVPADWSGYDLTLRTQQGDIQVDGANATLFGVFAYNGGNVFVSNCKSAWQALVNIENGFADVNIEAPTAIFVASGKRGSATLNCTTDNLNCSAVNGSVNFVTSASKITLESVRGNIVGTVKGNITQYTVNAKSDRARCNLTDSKGGAKLLNVHSERGKIEITFDSGEQQ